MKENILYGNTNAKNSEILKASEDSNVSEFINSDEILNLVDDRP